MHGYIKYFDNDDKNMTFVTNNEKVYDKYNEIWEVIRKRLMMLIIKIIFLKKEVITFVFQQ